jgi:cystathionine beta-lyase/cystathionine gamma-synthase
MRLTDLAAAAALAHRRGLRLVVDNTFASPAFSGRSSLAPTS